MLKRRTVIAGLAALPAAHLGFGALSGALAQTEPTADSEGDVIETSQGDLVIHPIAHATLVLEWGGHVIYVDPAEPAEAYEGLPAPTAILITHEHGDHYVAEVIAAIAGNVPMIVNPAVYDMLDEGLQGQATSMANGDTGTISGIPIEAIPAYNVTEDRLQYHPEGRDNGYILTFGDKRVLISGDTENTPELQALTGIDVAFLSMNLPYTMSVEQAVEAVNAFAPAIVYPYHHRGSDLEAFQSGVGDQTEVRIANWYPNGEG
jgi:L-ascorbate metabolism protein UlaG (beta-lactamase superfamily)